MTDLLALAETISSGNLRCTVCGCNMVLRDPTDDDRLSLRAAEVREVEDGRFVGRCVGC